MKAVLCVLATYVFFCALAVCQEESVSVAPLIVFDSEGKRVAGGGVGENKAFLSCLNSYYFGGLVGFSKARSDGDIVSLIDAASCCETHGSRWLLYGYIRKSENSVRAEVKLFSATKRKIEKVFYGMDGEKDTERMLGEMAAHIADYFYEKTGAPRDERPEEDKGTTCGLFADLGWWTHCEDVFRKRLNGIIDITLGADLKNGNFVKVIQGRNVYLWFRVETGFRLALGDPDYYKANFYAVRLAVPAVFRIEYTEQHSLCLGLGPGWEIDILDFQKKYESCERHVANMFEMVFTADYMYCLNERMALTAGFEAVFATSDRIGSWISMRTGFEYTF